MARTYVSNKIIYIVDDSDMILTQVKEILGDHFHVRTLNAATKLLALAARGVSNPPDMILLDIEMPEMHGAEAMAKIRGIPDWFNVPVVLLTAWNSDMLLEHFFTMGALDVIHKPVIKSVLINRVENYLKLSEYVRKYGDGGRRYSID